MSKFAVVGSRNITDYSLVSKILHNYNISTIISGAAKGIDELSEKYANDNNIPTIIHYADWNKFGKSAGMIRNEYIINDSDEVIAIWDGFSKGTKNSIDRAKKALKPLYLYIVSDGNICLKTYNKPLKTNVEELFEI